MLPFMSLVCPRMVSLPALQRLSCTSKVTRMSCQFPRNLHQLQAKASKSIFSKSHLCNGTKSTWVLSEVKYPFRFLQTQARALYKFQTPSVINGVHTIFYRQVSGSGNSQANKTSIIYIAAIGIFMVGAAYAGVPLYRMFCQSSGLGGQAVAGHDTSKITTMAPVKDRQLTIKFNADTASSMKWNFKPQQAEVLVVPGETALAFYTARNPTDKPIIGISTYNVIPFEAGQYFNKIQCFCFEEQRLNPHEQVDMPVFFYIDPDYAEDPKLSDVELITLSYTFFEAKDGLKLPLPGYVQPRPQPT